MYRATNKQDYGQKIISLANLFSGIFFTDTEKNCYVWYHRGWSSSAWCNEEDIGHGYEDLQFPLLYNRLITETGSFFNNELMTRFRNTFTKNLWSQEFQGFNFSVFGDEGPVFYRESCVLLEFNASSARSAALGWSPLYKFDGYDATATAPHVSKIFFDYFKNHIRYITTHNNPLGDLYEFFASGNLKGLGQIAAAQWDLEDHSLTLKNRSVVYNQDFAAKECLWVKPAALNDFDTAWDTSFADPVISENKFIINPGAKVTMKAGKKIVLEKGFHAKPGAEFHADIVTIGSLGTRNGKLGKTGEALSATGYASNHPEWPVKPSIFPNPTRGSFSIISEPGVLYSVFIYNLLGDLIYKLENTAQPVQVDLSDQPKGIYSVQVCQQNSTYIEKVVFQ